MQLALGTRKGWWDEDRPSRGCHRRKRSQHINIRRRGGRRSSSTSGHAQSSLVPNKQHTPWALGFNPSLLAFPPRRAASEQNSTPLETDSYSRQALAVGTQILRRGNKIDLGQARLLTQLEEAKHWQCAIDTRVLC